MADDSPQDPPGEPTSPTGIDLGDGTWVDIGRDGRWHPSAGERIRAVVIIGVFLIVLGGVAILLSVGDDDTRRATGDAPTASTSSTTTSTTSTTAPPDPSSVGGNAPSERCSNDDRSSLPLRPRDETTVLVLNGTSRSGHAGTNTTDLDRRGYETVEPGNADRRDRTAIGYKPGFCAEGERMANDLGFPLAEVEPVPRNLPVVVGRAELVVTLGRDSL